MNRLAKPLLAATMLVPSVSIQAQTASAPAAASAAPTIDAPAFPLELGPLPPAAPIAAQAIPLRTLAELSSRYAKAGDQVSFEVVENVLVDGKLVIPAGSRAFGEVTQVERKRGWGKPGSLSARILYVSVGTEKVTIDGEISATGESRKKKAIRTSLLIAPFCGFWIRGRDAVVPAATTTTAYLPGAIALALAAKRSPVLASAPVAMPATIRQVPSAALLASAGFVTPVPAGAPTAEQGEIAPAHATGDALR